MRVACPVLGGRGYGSRGRDSIFLDFRSARPGDFLRVDRFLVYRFRTTRRVSSLASGLAFGRSFALTIFVAALRGAIGGPVKPGKTVVGMTGAAMIYTRLSVADAASLSHESQEATARAYCLHRGLSVSERVSDDGVSGSVPFDERAGGQRVLELAAHGAASHVVVAKLDRFARSAIDALTWLDKLAAHGVALHCLDLGLDTSTPVGRLVYTVIAAVAELERARIRERTREGLAIRKATGRVYGAVPFGFKRRGDRLEPVPEQLEAIAAAAEARAGGATWDVVGKLFEGFEGPMGGRMGRTTVQRIVNRALKEAGAA